MIWLYVGLGGAIGAVARFGAVSLATKWLGAGFPYGTLFVNVVGSLLIGLLAGWISSRGGDELRAFAMTGILGGFTTFSAYSLDVMNLIERKAHMEAMLYAFGSVGLSVLFCFLGLSLMRALLS